MSKTNFWIFFLLQLSDLSSTPLVWTDSWCCGLKGKCGSLVSMRRCSADPSYCAYDPLGCRAEEFGVLQTASLRTYYIVWLCRLTAWGADIISNQASVAPPTSETLSLLYLFVLPLPLPLPPSPPSCSSRLWINHFEVIWNCMGSESLCVREALSLFP